MKFLTRLFKTSSARVAHEVLKNKVNAFGVRLNRTLQQRCSRVSILKLRVFFVVFGVLLTTYYCHIVIMAIRSPKGPSEIGYIRPPQSLTNAIRFADSSSFQSRLRIVRFRHYIDSLETDSVAGPIITKLLTERPGFMDSVTGRETSQGSLP